MSTLQRGENPGSVRPPGSIWERWTRSVGRSAPLHDALFALFLGGILAYGAAFAWYVLDRFDLVNLLRDINCDDAFYYFQTAWHMAGGEFSTFDGGITRTNGYHPLWMFLVVPFYRVFDKTEALFAIKAFEIMLVAGGVALVAGAARVARLPWILLFAALPALCRNTALFAGMEAAAALFLLGLFLLAICLFAHDPTRWRWPLAAVAFALPWVRLDTSPSRRRRRGRSACSNGPGETAHRWASGFVPCSPSGRAFRFSPRSQASWCISLTTAPSSAASCR